MEQTTNECMHCSLVYGLQYWEYVFILQIEAEALAGS